MALCPCATHELLASLLHGEASSGWGRFLAQRQNLTAVVGHLVAVSREEVSDMAPTAALGDLQVLVEEAVAPGGRSMFPVLRSYLGHRAYIPRTARSSMDEAARAGNKAALTRALALTLALRRVTAQRRLDGLPREVLDHWYAEALAGHRTSAALRKIPGQIAEAGERLLAHLTQQHPTRTFARAAVFEKYAPVFTAPDIPAAVDIMTGIERHDLRSVDVQAVGPFLRRLSKDESLERFPLLKEWMARSPNYPMAITSVLAEFLSRPGDFPSMLAELDRLTDETRSGRFRVDNQVQRDLHFGRFDHEYARLYGTNRRLPYVNESQAELYRRFTALPELSYDEPEHWSLDGTHLREVHRLAWEAGGFLQFLRELRAGTTRPIVVVGNNRYGRQWIVEPLEGLLGDGIELRYDGAPSHQSIRLSVPSARNLEWSADNTGPWTTDVFPMEFVRRMAREMPHIVIADAMSPGRYRGLAMFSRATKTYANWFAAFNDVRASGDRSVYEHGGCLPPDEMEELRHWYEFVRLRRQLSEWVTPGPTYRLGLWAPELTELVQFGDVRVAGRPAVLGTDEPQVVLANPMIYRTEGDDLPEALRGTSPYYFDGPEKHVQEEILFGFGPYGFQPAVRGTMTATFVAAVQRRITAEVEKLLSE